MIPILFHPTAVIHLAAHVLRGDIVGAMCYAGAGVVLGESVLLNIGCLIDHKRVIGEGSQMPMSCVVRNEVKIEPCSTFLRNAVIEQVPGAFVFMYRRVIKRTIDIISQVTGLIALSPLFLILSISAIVADPGSVFFTAKHIGQTKTKGSFFHAPQIQAHEDVRPV